MLNPKSTNIRYISIYTYVNINDDYNKIAHISFLHRSLRMSELNQISIRSLPNYIIFDKQIFRKLISLRLIKT